jgi:hypothetical protein
MERLYSLIGFDNRILRCEFYEEGSQPENTTLKLSNGHIKPMYDPVNDEIYEGATILEISAIKTPEKMEQLQKVVSDLRIRAKGAAIGKTGTNAYILAQVEFYEIKNEQCLNTNNPQEVEDLLQNEADEYGITLEQFKALVISRYNDAKEKYNLFMRMIERCRTKIQTLIENNNWENVETAFGYVSSLNNVEQAQQVMNDILAL